MDQDKSTFKITRKGWLYIIAILFVSYCYIHNSDKKKESSSDEIIVNNAIDASVYQVQDYLKNTYLNDPDSYEPISWSAVIKLNDNKQEGYPAYQVRHKFRAKNEYGGYVTEEKIFKLDYKGNVVDVEDYQR